MVPSGFKRFVHLSFINQFLKMWHWLASTASNKKGAKIQLDISRFYQKFFFQNIKMKLNSRNWMAMKSSVVIFQALEPLRSQWPLQPQQPPWPHFIKKNTDPDGLIIPGTHMTNIDPLKWNRSSKIQIFTGICALSVGGCWGQPMLLFWKLTNKTQMFELPEATRHHNLLKLSILLPVRANSLCNLQ